MQRTVRAFFGAFIAAAALVALTAEAQAQSQRAYCRQVASQYANEAASGSTVSGAAGGALLGAGFGALLGGRGAIAPSAIIGGGVGAMSGAANGSAEWRRYYWRRFNDCMAGY